MRPRVRALIAGYRREVWQRRLFAVAFVLGAVFFPGLYLYLLIGLGRTDTFYITLSLATIVHALSRLVVLFYFEVPGVVRDLHSSDLALADDAWAAIEHLRPELLPRLLIDLNVPADERSTLASDLDRPGLIRLTEARAHDRWRTIGPIYLVGYLLTLSAYLYLVYSHEPEIMP